VHTAAHDHALLGAILISAADMGAMGARDRKKVVAGMADDMESLAGVTAESMADEVIVHSKEFGFSNAVTGLVRCAAGDDFRRWAGAKCGPTGERDQKWPATEGDRNPRGYRPLLRPTTASFLKRR